MQLNIHLLSNVVAFLRKHQQKPRESHPLLLTTIVLFLVFPECLTIGLM